MPSYQCHTTNIEQNEPATTDIQTATMNHPATTGYGSQTSCMDCWQSCRSSGTIKQPKPMTFNRANQPAPTDETLQWYFMLQHQFTIA